MQRMWGWRIRNLRLPNAVKPPRLIRKLTEQSRMISLKNKKIKKMKYKCLEIQKTKIRNAGECMHILRSIIKSDCSCHLKKDRITLGSIP